MEKSETIATTRDEWEKTDKGKEWWKCIEEVSDKGKECWKCIEEVRERSSNKSGITQKYSAMLHKQSWSQKLD